MFDLPRPARLGLSSLAIMVAALAVGLTPSPRTAFADDQCPATGSPAGPFDILAYEAADWRTTYSKTLELASQNLLFPDNARFSLPQLETGPRSAGSSTLVAPYIPPTLLKAIAWIESHWKQADYSVPHGAVGPVLVSHSCAYGTMQVLSGMQNTTGVPNLDQVMIGGHYGFNIAEGANILATKWNAAPSYRPIVGTRQPITIEDWYYALWSYHGFTFSNHPLNPRYSPSRGMYRCDGTQSYSSFPYQELVLGCVANPPVVGGTRLWNPQPVTLPNLSDPAFSLSNWKACSVDHQCTGMDITTPAPSHADSTQVSGNRTQAIGSPTLTVSPANITVALAVEETSKPTTMTVSNVGTGPLVWRLSPSKNWLGLSRIQGVSLGTDLGSLPGSFDLYADASGLEPGTYTGEVNVLSHYTRGLPQKISVNLSVGWDLRRSRMLAADVNGDGKDDIVGIYDYGRGRMGMWTFVSDGTNFSKVNPSYTGCEGCWELSRSQMLAADVNGDGKDDIVGVYDYGGGRTRMWSFISDGTNFSTVNLSHAGCDGCWELSRSQMLTADVNGDDKDDIVGVYDYGGGRTRMWSFISNGTSFSTVKLSHAGCDGCWELSRSRMVAADVNGDNKDDIAGVYDYGGGRMGMWNFVSNGTSFTSVNPSYTGCEGCWELSRSRIVAADVNGDGKDDIVGVYDYGGGRMGMWSFVSDGTSFSSVNPSYTGCEGCWELSRSQMLAADVNGDGKDDIVGVYDHGAGLMGMSDFVSDGTNFSVVRLPYLGCGDCRRLSRSRMVAADVNGDGKDDIVGIYDYGRGRMGMWTFVSDGTNFSKVNPSYTGCEGCWELSRSQMLAADVNGDGKDDIVGVYDYGGGRTRMWSFISDGTNFSTVNLSHAGCDGCWELSRSQMLTADINGDGKDDIVGVYDYGGGRTRMWSFISNGTTFSTVNLSHAGCDGCWVLSRSRMVAADVNGDGKDDIVGVYDYGGGRMGMWNFVSDGTSFTTVNLSHAGCDGCWELSRSQMLAADVNGDSKDDIVGVYDYGGGRMGMWTFVSDGTSFSSVNPSYTGCEGCWELSRSQMLAANVNGDDKDDIVGVYDYGSVVGIWDFINGGSGFTVYLAY